MYRQPLGACANLDQVVVVQVVVYGRRGLRAGTAGITSNECEPEK